MTPWLPNLKLTWLPGTLNSWPPRTLNSWPPETLNSWPPEASWPCYLLPQFCVPPQWLPPAPHGALGWSGQLYSLLFGKGSGVLLLCLLLLLLLLLPLLFIVLLLFLLLTGHQDIFTGGQQHLHLQSIHIKRLWDNIQVKSENFEKIWSSHLSLPFLVISAASFRCSPAAWPQ